MALSRLFNPRLNISTRELVNFIICKILFYLFMAIKRGLFNSTSRGGVNCSEWLSVLIRDISRH